MLSALGSQTFDLIIIGGGIIGAGVARDAALRGLKVALFEKEDFGWGTTAGSTRLIHGGLRYLEMLDFKLVRLDLRERETLLRIAPHLVKPLEFFLPFYGRSIAYRTKMRLGMMLYDLLSYDKSLPRHRVLSADEMRAIEPSLAAQNLQGAVAYYDAQAALPERLCLENIIDAREHGAQVFNHAEVTGALRSGADITGVRVRDLLSDEARCVEVNARIVVNASGPWFDKVAGRLTAAEAGPRIRATKGIHLAARPANKHALVLFSPVDERLFFVIPWLGYSWIGTTDTDFSNDPGAAHADAADVEYLLESVKSFYPALAESPVYFSNAGVRALVRKEGAASSVSRKHRIEDGAARGAAGLISVLGGKITGYRAIAEETVDLVCAKLKLARRCRTASAPLPGARDASGKLNNNPGLNEEVITHLSRLYGARAGEVLEIAATNCRWRDQLSPAHPDIAAQVVHAIRFEQCARLNDFMLRRSQLGFSRDQGQGAVRQVASLMADELGWSAARLEEELGAYRRYVDQTQAFRQIAAKV